MVRYDEAAKRNGQIDLTVALDVAVALKGRNAARSTEPSDSTGEVERFAHGVCADLRSSFRQQALQFGERYWLCPQWHPLFAARAFIRVGGTRVASALRAYCER